MIMPSRPGLRMMGAMNPTQRYSIWSLLRNGLSYHEGWQRQWRSPEPKRAYDAIVVGAGGHGLATAYYLAKEHGIRNVAVLERGWLGGGNTGRNTTIVRSNDLWDEAIPDDVRQRLMIGIGKVLAMPAIREKIAATGIDPMPLTGADFQEFLRVQYETLGKVIRSKQIVLMD